MKLSRRRTIWAVFGVLVVSLAAVIQLGQGCSRNFSATRYSTNGNSNPSSSLDQGQEGSPASSPLLPRTLADCLTSSDPDIQACIFDMSPFNQNPNLAERPLTTADNRSLQTYAVSISGLSGKGKELKNAVIAIQDGGVTLSQGPNGWKFSGSSEAEVRKLLQVHNYYHINFLKDIMERVTGSTLSVGPLLLEICSSDEAITDNGTFIASEGRIILGSGRDIYSPKYCLAYDGDVALHEFTHALAFFGSSGRFGQSASLSCPLDKAQKLSTGRYLMTCYDSSSKQVFFLDAFSLREDESDVNQLAYGCTEAKGCATGLNEGQADMGPYIVNPNLYGIGMTAEMKKAGFRSARNDMGVQTSQARVTFQYQGVQSPYFYEAHMMGRIYASIWFCVYQKANYSDQLVRLFFEHEKVLTDSDDFSTVFTKIQSLDAVAQASGKTSYIEFFRSCYEGHGLNVP